MRSAFAAALLVLVAAPQLACRNIEQQMAKRELAGLCDAATDAAKKNADPAGAYKDIVAHHGTSWPLKKTWAAVQEVETSRRYGRLLQFARNDRGIEGWSCPALDLLLLRLLHQQGHDGSGPGEYPIVGVSSAGVISIDGRVVAPSDLKQLLKALYEDYHVVNFFRDGWEKGMPPNVDVVLTELIDQRFIISMCARPGCPN